MLSPADADVVRRDPSLPGLVLLLDPPTLAGAVRRALPEAAIGDLAIDYLRYKPGTSCLAAGVLETKKGAVLFSAKAHLPEAHDKLEKSRRSSRRATALGPEKFVLEDAAIAFHVFPSDRSIRSLRWLADPGRRAGLIAALLPGVEAVQGEIRTLRYKPERRWVGTFGSDGVPAAVLRLYAPGGCEVALRNATAFRPRGALRLAKLLGGCENWGAIALEWLSGALLTRDLRELERTGEALAILHIQAADALSRRTAESEAVAVTEAAAAVAATCPELSAPAENLALQVTERLSEIPEGSASLHGDFHAGQVVLDGDGVGFLDLDRATRGDPAADFGSFLATVQAEDEAAPVVEVRDALLAGYRRAGGAVPPPDRISLHHAAALLKVAPHPFRMRRPAWPERTAALLEHARRALEATSSRSVHAVTIDPAIQSLAPALDRRAAEAALRALPALSVADVRVRSVRVLRHKRGRRCVVEYELSSNDGGALTVLGKVRAKGADERTHLVESALREEGVPIPEPLGVVPELGMRVQRKVPGVPATSLLPQPEGVSLSRRIADAIHAVHVAPLVPSRRHGIDDELRILEIRLSEIARSRPAWEFRVEQLFRACAELASHLETVPDVPIHRDFYPDQVLVDGEKIWLLDFDLFCAGDPALDAGNFSAHLIEQGIRFAGEAPGLDRAAAAFEDRFAELSGENARRRARIHTVLSLARHVSLSLEIPGRAPFASAVLEKCELAAKLQSVVPAGSGLAAGGAR
jgi:Ser/Thr protein kinase RdoA (MazF antagonist)